MCTSFYQRCWHVDWEASLVVWFQITRTLLKVDVRYLMPSWSLMNLLIPESRREDWVSFVNLTPRKPMIMWSCELGFPIFIMRRMGFRDKGWGWMSWSASAPSVLLMVPQRISLLPWKVFGRVILCHLSFSFLSGKSWVGCWVLHLRLDLLTAFMLGNFSPPSRRWHNHIL